MSLYLLMRIDVGVRENLRLRHCGVLIFEVTGLGQVLEAREFFSPNPNPYANTDSAGSKASPTNNREQ